MSRDAHALQKRIGGRVRQRRTTLGYTVKVLAERSGLSPRFLSDVEAGKANISVSRLEALADALGLALTSLLRPTAGSARQRIEELLEGRTDEELTRLLDVIEIALGRRTPRVIALLGVRGAGKSTVGRLLARALSLPLVELADRIEAAAGLSLGDIFTLHGERYYRTIELRCFAELVASGIPCVVALPGGVVSSDAALTLLKESCTSVWLEATAQDYWSRVFSQGDTRPMAGRADAMADLRTLIQQRDPLYRQADLVVNTSGVSPEQVTATILTALDTPRL